MKSVNLDGEVQRKSKSHYSAAVEHNGIIYVSGQLPMNTEKGTPVDGGIKEQTRAVFQRLSSILEAAGSSKEQVLRTTAYIPDISLWDEVNQIYSEFFGDHKPARTVVPTTKLHFGCLIEIDAIAIVNEKR